MSKVSHQPTASQRGGKAHRLFAIAPKISLAVLVVAAGSLCASGLIGFRLPRLLGLDQGAGNSCSGTACERLILPKRHASADASAPTGKPRLLEFTSQHCPSCSKMAPIIAAMERQCTAHDGTILPIDIDADEGAKIAELFSVSQLPTFLMIDSRGKEVERLVGEQPKQRLALALADVSGVLCVTL